MNKGKIRLIALGGIGDVTKNMYLYEYYPPSGNPEILIVDCGVGFPDTHMYGVDLVIPDITYLLNKTDQIKGIVLTHGHEDHTAALPYILPKLNAPVFATKLTAALAQVRLEEAGVNNQIIVCDRDKRLIRGNFNVEFVHMTHSIPDANHLIIRTPAGTFYHGSDFKFDWTPVDGQVSEVGKIVNASQEEVFCLATDCLGSDREGYTPSERTIEGGFEKAIANCIGKFIVTTQSSNISRIQQAINVSLRNGRRVCLLGRSMLRNTEVAEKLHFLNIPHNRFVSEKEVRKIPPKQIALIVTGSQGEVEAALSRIASGDHKYAEIIPGDKVVFSADPIPGNEEAVHSLIDSLVDLGAEISYSEVLDDLHVSGHGSQNDLMLLLSLVKPKYIIPIGGTKRHMYHYRLLAQGAGYRKEQIFLLEDGSVVEFADNKAVLGKSLDVETVMVDGLGIGDVGMVVLRDRHKMAQDGIVVVIIPFDKHQRRLSGEMDIISRGFVYMKESAPLINQTKSAILSTLNKKKNPTADFHYIKKVVESTVEKFLYEKTHRRPMVIVF
ncbi:MAG: ribonuclease J [Patescibacteria group bacterium]|nr:ribonuclease J [Patescibacteria group bacterium]